MKLTAVVSTYNRPHLLPRTIACFEAQQYEDRAMVIYDDGGQYIPADCSDGEIHLGPRIVLISTRKREPALGRKRNQNVAHAEEFFPDTEAIVCVDDDDLFLPWHFSASAAALSVAPWSRPSQVLMGRVFGEHWLFQPHLTGCREDPTKNRMFHPAWAIRLDAFKSVGGYPDNESGMEDKTLMLKMEEAGVQDADYLEMGFGPGYIYNWGENNISGMLNRKISEDGSHAWNKLGRAGLEPAELDEWVPPFDLNCPTIAPVVRQRPF